MTIRIIVFTLVAVFSFDSFALDFKPDRRKDQEASVPAYFIVPLPYSKPGIGEGFVLLGNMANVAGTTADISLIEITGDAGGTIIHGEELPLISDWLSLEFNYEDITRANVNNYSIRGMDGTSKDDFNILEIGFSKELSTTLIFNFDQKRYNFFYTHSEGDFRIDAIKDNEGDLIEAANFEDSSKNDSFQFQIDYTDDHLDPRNGMRLSLSYADTSAIDSSDVDYYTLDFSAMAFFPMHEADTLVVNFYRSDAHVRTKGDTDPTAISAELDTTCAPGDTKCIEAKQELIDAIIDERTYGNANSLGGDLRLRSYPGDRYKGAHSVFLGAEYRWNFKQESTPFDYYIWKDVRTGLQAAFFAEVGSVSEVSSDLWEDKRFSFGAGVRLITASGGVYRADIATGDEGAEVIVIFNYPWE